MAFDDGLAVSDLSPQGVERTKKKMSAIFKKHNLEITIDANKKRIEFFDIYMDLDKNENGPFIKPNDTVLMWTQAATTPRKYLRILPEE